MRHVSKIVAASAAVLTSVVLINSAEAIVQKDSSAFPFATKYEMNDGDTGLTATGGTDWTKGGGSATMSGGFLSYNTTAGSSAYWQANPGIWDLTTTKHTTGWTIEWKLKVLSSIEDPSVPPPLNPPTAPMRDRAFSVFASDKATNPGTTALVEVGTGNTWTPSHNGSQLDNNINSDDYHTFRIAYDPDLSTTQFLVWRDGVALVEPGLPPSVLQTSGGFLNNTFYFGDGTGAYGGNVSIDYVRFVLEPFAPLAAPLPEPASLGSLLVGGLMLARRRRR